MSGKTHKVRLTWEASSSKMNPSLVRGLTYTDDTVESGVTYHHVARAADALGRRVLIPLNLPLPFRRIEEFPSFLGKTGRSEAKV